MIRHDDDSSGQDDVDDIDDDDDDDDDDDHDGSVFSIEKKVENCRGRLVCLLDSSVAYCVVVVLLLCPVAGRVRIIWLSLLRRWIRKAICRNDHESGLAM